MHSQTLLPIVLSIVGHRDPTYETAERNKNLFKDDLYKLVESFPHSPIFMLNGLASGMDLIAAKVFLELCHDRKDGLHHRLIGVLPKPFDQYKSEIRKDDWPLFEMVTGSCLTSVLDPSSCMALRHDDELAPLSVNIDSDNCYLRQSLFLVEHSSVLFAFTDGVNNWKKGGTSYTVQLAKNQVYSSSIDSSFTPFDYAPIGIVEYHTERLSVDSSSVPPFSVRYFKESDIKRDLSEITTALRKIDDMNHKFSTKKLQLPAGASLTLWKFIDRMAKEYKKHYQRGLLLFLCLGFLTAMTLVRPGWQVVGMTIILASVYNLPWIQARFRENFIAFRCLAESLLILEDWNNFGIYRNPADLFRTSLHHELEWVRVSLRSYGVNLLLEEDQEEIKISSTQLTAYQFKIEEQLQWLAASIRKQSKSDSRLLKIIVFVYLLGCCSSLVFLLLNQQIPNDELLEWITESLMALLVIAIGFRELKGFQEINARYARSIARIENSLSAIGIACDSLSAESPLQLQASRSAVRAIGVEKMDELNDWVSDQLRRSYSP